MCTLSWVIEAEGYQLFFNRDEQKHRAPALSPEIFTTNKLSVVMPVDPIGKGSWIASNELGVTVCLLNNYQGNTPKGDLISRGQIVKTLVMTNRVIDLKSALFEIPLFQFAPFTVVIFYPSNTPSILSYCWDGEVLNEIPAVSPMISSGVSLKAVTDYRKDIYKLITETGVTAEKLDKFHQHQHQQYGHLSVQMSRDDAQTVSVTNVVVNRDEIQMNYRPVVLDEKHELMASTCKTMSRLCFV
ncbi:MAG: NRDE family protein [Aliivibrio sp.]|uniref:NRDE family protein n=1 Tax=Aliivibrio sp. TaxID=1872443 RepID=UPI001A58D52C|nr:NRDE family protein [Aliivibrio sp.]